MRDHPVSQAPNYTTPALVMGFVNLVLLLWLIWAVWGLAPALLLAWGLNLLIRRLARSAD